MKTKRFLIFAACCFLAAALTGCGDGKVQSTVSKFGCDVSNAVSRVESALDPDDNVSSGVPDEDEQSSMPGYTSSQNGDAGGMGSDTDSGLESGGQVSSDVSGLDEESEASEKTKDL